VYSYEKRAWDPEEEKKVKRQIGQEKVQQIERKDEEILRKKKKQ